MVKCKTCGKETKNPKFCSRSCSAIHTNKQFPRRTKEGNCKSCGVKIHSSRTYCKKCFKRDHIVPDDRTLEYYTYKKKYQINSQVRDLARRFINKSGRPLICQCCLYDKHINVCHIKPISMFDMNTKISVINSNENLLILCPNCHWELDHGYYVFPMIIASQAQ